MIAGLFVQFVTLALYILQIATLCLLSFGNLLLLCQKENTGLPVKVHSIHLMAFQMQPHSKAHIVPHTKTVLTSKVSAS